MKPLIWNAAGGAVDENFRRGDFVYRFWCPAPILGVKTKGDSGIGDGGKGVLWVKKQGILCSRF